MAVEIISVGSEYLLQRQQNTDVVTIATCLLEIGVEVDYVSIVTGQENRLEEVLRHAIERSTLIFVVGGMNSGEYDLTKKLLTRVLKKQLVLNYRILDGIKAQYKNRGEEMPRNLEKRALVPTDAEILTNDIGLFPGFLFTQENVHVALLPGHAQELDAMLRTQILPRLDAKTFRLESTGALILKTCGISAEAIQDLAKNVERMPQYTINCVTDYEETSVIITLKAESQTVVAAKLESFESQLRKKLGNYVYGKGAHTLEEVVGALLTEKKQTVALAESCTGGLIASKMTDVPGSSVYFERGVVSYSNASKTALLDVSPNIIEKHGAVSAETAVAMAEGVRWLAQTTYGLAVTGIAGPGGATPDKPVGLVYIALAAEQGETQWQRYRFPGDRLAIRTRTAQIALHLLRQRILTEGRT